MMTKSEQAMTERDKQTKPLPGEVSPEEAFLKARQFAAEERRRSTK